MTRATRPTRKFAAAWLGAAALVVAGNAWAGDYKYWYYDPDAFFEAGDLSNGWAMMSPPAWACARRFYDGAELQWIGENGAGVGANNGGQELYTSFNVHFGTAAGCKPRPRMETHPGGALIPQRIGSHYVVIDPDAASYWVDKDGGWPVCNCKVSTTLKALSIDIRWPALGRVFDAQFDRTAPESGRPFRPIDIQALAAPLADLQRSVSAEVARRRLQTLPTIETAVRQLEDLALSSLSKAAAQVEQCRVAQDRGAHGDAYKSCDRARRAAMRAQRALKTVVDEMR